MELTKRTFALPPSTGSRFERKLETLRVSALRDDIADGCKQMWDIYRDTLQEWESEDDRLLRSVE